MDEENSHFNHNSESRDRDRDRDIMSMTSKIPNTNHIHNSFSLKNNERNLTDKYRNNNNNFDIQSNYILFNFI